MQLPIKKAPKFYPWGCVSLIIVVTGLFWGLTFYSVWKDGVNARAKEDLINRAGCFEQYETPECLKLRLKKAELKQQHEEALRDLKQDVQE